VPFRIVRHAEQRIDDILRESTQTRSGSGRPLPSLDAHRDGRGGRQARHRRFPRRPNFPAAGPSISGQHGVWSRRSNGLGRPVTSWSNLVARDGVVEILSVHGRMLLPRAAHEAQREAPD
jgi:hypothetical protein